MLPDAGSVARSLWIGLRAKPQDRDSLGARFAALAASHPQRQALRFEMRSWSYGELNAWANRIAATMKAFGVRRGDVIAVLMENRPEALVYVLAAVKLGAVAGMLNPQQRGAALEQAIGLVWPRAYIVGDECREAFDAVRLPRGRGAPLIWWDGEGAAPSAPSGYRELRVDSRGASKADPVETAQLTLAEPCFYIFTSGTTGLPKASKMTHFRWLRSFAGLGAGAVRLKPDDVLYCPLPLYHNNALTVAWSTVLAAGATLALGRRFSASQFWNEIRANGATAFCYIGELCRYLLLQPPGPNDRAHRVRVIVGNGLRPELWEAFQARFGVGRICEFYGASEGNLAFANAFGVARSAGYCPLSYAVVAFDAAQEQPQREAGGRLRRVGRGEVGLLITEVNEFSPFDGYTDSAASQARLLRGVFADDDCWFDTGDLVRDQGFHHIQFVDRVGDTFRWKGENVASTEVEAALNACTGVEEAVVYGVQLPHADGRAGMAALTLSGRLDGKALQQQLAQQLPAYALPLFLRLREAQQTTGTFKLRKVELKREGCDPRRIDEPLYVLRDRQRGYEPLDAALYRRIEAGELRF